VISSPGVIVRLYWYSSIAKTHKAQDVAANLDLGDLTLRTPLALALGAEGKETAQKNLCLPQCGA
jgi:hypothetical protein